MSKPHRESKTFSKEDKEIFVFEDMWPYFNFIIIFSDIYIYNFLYLFLFQTTWIVNLFIIDW